MDGKLRIASHGVCDIYISWHIYLYVGIYIYMLAYIFICAYIHNPRVHGRFYGLDLKKELVVLENKPLRMLDQLMMKKMTADSKSKRKNTGYTRPTWSIAVRERLLELYCDCFNALALDGIQALNGS